MIVQCKRLGSRDELGQLKYVHPSAKARGSIPSDSDQTKRICTYSTSNDMRLLLSGKVSKLPKKEWGDNAFFEMNRVESGSIISLAL